MVSRDNLLAWIEALQKVYSENKQYLTELDSAIGDADHGINMNRGFTNSMAELEKKPPEDITTALKTVAMALIHGRRGGRSVVRHLFYESQYSLRRQGNVGWSRCGRSV
jgi:dihydroxyacetone kinase-like protein